MRFFNQVPESFEDNLAHIDDLGGPSSYNHYAWGWAWAGDTPFRRWKRETYRGGSTDPFILAWPAGMAARGEIRTQYAHAIDMVPTVLDCLGIDPPERIRGVDAVAAGGRELQAHVRRRPTPPPKHVTQYFEMFGHRAIYHEGWRAVCPWPAPNFTSRGEARAQARRPDHAGGARGARPQRLGALPHGRRPDRVARPRRRAPGELRELVARWWEEAEKYKVLPLDSACRRGWRPSARRRRGRAPATSYYPGGSVVPAFAAPPVYNRAALDRGRRRDPRRGRRGRADLPGRRCRRLRLLHEGRPAALPLQLRRPAIASRCWPSTTASRRAATPLRYEFEPTGEPDIANGKGVPGRGQLYIDGKLVGAGDFPHTTPLFFELEGLSCGFDFGAPATEYAPPFPFTGTIRQVSVRPRRRADRRRRGRNARADGAPIVRS